MRADDAWRIGPDERLAAGRKLAIAVLDGAVRDAHSHHLPAKREQARAFLQHASPLRALWLEVAGLNPAAARSRPRPR